MKNIIYYGSLVLIFISTYFITSEILFSKKVLAKPAIQCLANCNKLIISVDKTLSGTTYTEGFGSVVCGGGTKFCEFYTVLLVQVQESDGSWSNYGYNCMGGALNCGQSIPINSGRITLIPGFNYYISFVLFDVNKGCGTCSLPEPCMPTCLTYGYVDLRRLT